MTKDEMEDSIHLRAVRYGAERPNGFSYKDIEHHYSKRLAEWEVVKVFLLDARKNKDTRTNLVTPFQILRTTGSADEAAEYTLSYEAYFNYLDYLELVEARKNAKQAHESSLKAMELAQKSIKIAVATMLITVLVALLQILAPVNLAKLQFDQLLQAIECD